MSKVFIILCNYLMLSFKEKDNKKKNNNNNKKTIRIIIISKITHKINNKIKIITNNKTIQMNSNNLSLPIIHHKQKIKSLNLLLQTLPNQLLMILTCLEMHSIIMILKINPVINNKDTLFWEFKTSSKINKISQNNHKFINPLLEINNLKI